MSFADLHIHDTLNGHGKQSKRNFATRGSNLATRGLVAENAVRRPNPGLSSKAHKSLAGVSRHDYLALIS
jgi:hypothetical protein